MQELKYIAYYLQGLSLVMSKRIRKGCRSLKEVFKKISRKKNIDEEIYANGRK